MLHDPAFWVAIAFVVFIGVMIKFAYGTIISNLDERARIIKKELDEALKLREDAQALLAGYQRKQRDALSDADDIISQARAEAERMAEEAERALQDEIQRRTNMAVGKIAQAEAKVVQEILDTTTDIAIKAASQIISSNIDDTKATSLIDDSIADIETKLH